MAFTGELSKLCWGIVTSDQVQLIIIFSPRKYLQVNTNGMTLALITWKH